MAQENHLKSITDLPVEIILIITDQLPNASVICFALTSKHFLIQIGTVCFLDPALQLPVSRRDWAAARVKGIVATKRYKFLETLQRGDPRWVFCPECWILHPTLDSSTDPEKAQLPCQSAASSGIVVVTPCRRIHKAGARRIMRAVEDSPRGELHWHHCRLNIEVHRFFYGRPSHSTGAAVQFERMPLDTNVAFEKSGRDLIAWTRYVVTGTKVPGAVVVETPGLFCCPHMYPKWCSTHGLGAGQVGSMADSAKVECTKCSTIIFFSELIVEEGTWVLNISVRRNLGNLDKSDKKWAKQRSFPPPPPPPTRRGSHGRTDLQQGQGRCCIVQ